MKKYLLFLFVFTLFITLLGFNPSISKADWDDLLLDKIGCLSLSTTMAIEDTSAEVSKLQSFLSAGYFFNGEFRGQPGYFGTETKSAVQMFQQQSGLVSDGVVGRATRAAIRNVTCNRLGTTSPSQLPEGCTSTQGYSPTTGQRCNVSIPIMPVALPPGCTSTSGYSSTTGEPCGVATMPPIVSYPGFFITFSKTSYLPTENVVATLSRADGSSSGYTVDSYIQSGILDEQFFRSISVGQNTRLVFRANQLASYKGPGQYILLLCDGGKVCGEEVGTNSNYFTISSSSYPPGCNSNQGYSSTTGQRCGDGTTTLISPVLISQNISVVSGDTSDTAQGSFKFTVYSPSSDIQIYRTIPEKSIVKVLFAVGENNDKAVDSITAVLTATSGSSSGDSSSYYKIEEGESRAFALNFFITPTNGTGSYRAKAISLEFSANEKGIINFGNEFVTNYVHLRGNSTTPTRGVDLKVNGSSNPATVAYNSIIEVGWGTTGLNINETECSASGHYVPRVDGGLWNDLHNLSANGIEKLYARHNTYGYISSLQISIQCSDDGGVAVNDTVSIPVSQTPQPSITVTSPWSGGEKVTAGSSYTVRWKSSNIPVTSDMKVFIISKGEKGYSQMIMNGPNTGYLPITIPSQLAGDYEFMVQTAINGNVYSGSSFAYIIPSTVDTTRRDTIISYYKKYLARTYDQEGLDFWMNSSKTLDQIREGFFDSVEYKTRREDIRQLYLSLLKREPDSAGWDYWANNGLTLGDIKSGVYASYEYTTKQSIAQLYRDLLGREPDDAGLNYWFDQMSTYGKTIKQIEDGIRASQEYLNRNSTSSSLGASVIYALPMGCSGTQGYSAATGKSCNSR